MKEQKLITDTMIQHFETRVNKWLYEGWRIVPKTLKIKKGNYAVFLEKDEGQKS